MIYFVGDDYTISYYKITFEEGTITKRVVYETHDDHIVENDERFNLTIVEAVNEYGPIKIEPNRTAEITIYNDDGKCIIIIIKLLS